MYGTMVRIIHLLRPLCTGAKVMTKNTFTSVDGLTYTEELFRITGVPTTFKEGV